MLFQGDLVAAPRHDLLVAAGISVLSVAVTVAAAIIYYRATHRKPAGATAAAGSAPAAVRPRSFAVPLAVGGAWLAGTYMLARSGVLQRFDVSPPPAVLYFGFLLLLSLALGLSDLGRKLSERASLIALVALQSFRLPLELLMHRAAEKGIMPKVLSYSGLNFDIITGATALILTVLMLVRVGIPRRTLWAWNVFGMACLLMIMFLAVTTSPVVRMWGDRPDQLNTWVMYAPYVWLPSVLVVTAIASHVVITRKLLAQQES